MSNFLPTEEEIIIRLQDLYEEALEVIEVAKTRRSDGAGGWYNPSPELALSGIQQASTLLMQIRKISVESGIANRGEMSESRWEQLRAMVVKTLEKHPEAKKEILLALESGKEKSK